MNTLSVALLSTGAQFFLTADEIGPIISPHQHKLASSCDEPAKSVYKRICIKLVRDFDVDGSDRQTRENTAIPLPLTSSLLLHKWAKEVDPNMTERRLFACNTFLRKICHLLTTHRSLSPSAAETLARSLRTAELARIT